MNPDFAIQIARQAMIITLLLSAPMLIFGLVVGLLISILQAVTQVNEMTLTFVPKIVIVGLVTLLLTPWMVNLLVEYSRDLIHMMGDAPRAGGM